MHTPFKMSCTKQFFFFPKEVGKCCTITCVYVKDLNYKPKVVNQKSLEPGSWSQDLAYDRKKQRELGL